MGHRFKWSDFSDDEEEKGPVVVEEEENENLEQKKPLPHYEVVSDKD